LARQFYGQIGKESLIIDLRWNSGGMTPERFVEMLHRPVLNYWAVRYGFDTPVPIFKHQGPKCVLINGSTGSSGELFPYYFRRMGLGPLIGTRTWGGIIGSVSSPLFIDGGAISIPHHAFYGTEGKWGIELFVCSLANMLAGYVDRSNVSRQI
jgi:tricorn protease